MEKIKPLNYPTPPQKLKVAVGLIAILMVLFLGKGLFFDTKSEKKVSEDKQLIEVRFATAKTLWNTLPFIAYDRGFFEDECLNVKIRYLEAGRYCLDALVSDSVDLGMIVDTNISYFGYTGNTSVAVIASMQEVLGSGIIAKRSSGINKPEDLKGKKLALSPGTTSDTFANRFMEKYGLTDSGIKIEKIQPLTISSAIISDNVDAASTWDPHLYNISKVLDDDAIIFRNPEIYTSYSFLAIRIDRAMENREVVLAFLRATKRAAEFIKNNKEEAQEIVARLINVDIDIVKNTWDLNKFEVSLNSEMIAEINKQGIEIQATDDYRDKPLPDYSVYFDSNYINQVNQ